MFSEVILIKARLDSLEAKKMENDLSNRFKNVARKFRTALSTTTRFALGGSLFGGIGLALINKILEPLKEIEERVKAILGQSTDIADEAEKLGGTTGQLFTFEKVAKSAGFKDEESQKLLEAFQAKQVQARLELANPDLEQHRSTQVLGDIAKNKNAIEGFLQFREQLRGLNPEKRLEQERAIFEEKLTGPGRRLVDLNYNETSKTLGLGNAKKVEDILGNNQQLAQRQRTGTTRNEILAFTEQSALLSKKDVDYFNEKQRREDIKFTKKFGQLSEYEKLQTSADKIQNLLDKITKAIEMGVVIGDEWLTQKIKEWEMSKHRRFPTPAPNRGEE